MIYEVLSTGAENAKPGREICRELNITARELTLTVERERRHGKPICASTRNPPGYFIAANQEEMELYCRSLLRRAEEIIKTSESCIETMENLPI